MALILSCSVQIFKMIGQISNKLRAKKFLCDLNLRWISEGYPLLSQLPAVVACIMPHNGDSRGYVTHYDYIASDSNPIALCDSNSLPRGVKKQCRIVFSTIILWIWNGSIWRCWCLLMMRRKDILPCCCWHKGLTLYCSDLNFNHTGVKESQNFCVMCSNSLHVIWITYLYKQRPL